MTTINQHCFAFVYDERDTFSLEIELENQRAVTLTYWKNGDRPTVSLWHGCGEHDFGDDSLEAFKDWAEAAVTKRAWLVDTSPVSS